MISERHALRGLLRAGGIVAIGAGLDTIVRGARSVIGEGTANAAVESELRFYSAFYVAYGLAVLRVAPRADRDPAAVRAAAGTLFLAGVGRAGGWAAAGRPTPVQRALLAIELAAPPLVTAWQARVARHFSAR